MFRLCLQNKSKWNSIVVTSKRTYYFLDPKNVSAVEVMRETRMVTGVVNGEKEQMIEKLYNDQPLFKTLMSDPNTADSLKLKEKAKKDFEKLFASHHKTEFRLSMEAFNKMKHTLHFASLPVAPKSTPSQHALNNSSLKIKEAIDTDTLPSNPNVADVFSESARYMVLCSARFERWGDVGSLLNECMDKMIIPPYGELIKWARDRKKPEVGLEIFEHALKFDKQVPVSDATSLDRKIMLSDAYAQAIGVYADMGSSKEARKLFESMEGNKVTKTMDAYNAVLDACRLPGNNAYALQVYDTILSNEKELEERRQKALIEKRKMEAAGSEVDGKDASLIIKASLADFDVEIKPNVYTYGYLFRSFVLEEGDKLEKAKKADALFQECLNGGYAYLDNVATTSMLFLLFEAKQYKRMFTIYDEMKELLGNRRLDTTTYRLIKIAGKRKVEDDAALGKKGRKEVYG